MPEQGLRFVGNHIACPVQTTRQGWTVMSELGPHGKFYPKMSQGSDGHRALSNLDRAQPW